MSKPRVLVVDDNRDLADGIGMLLAELPADVTITYSVDEAAAHLERATVELVVSDIRMPNRDGMALLSLIREQWPDTRVIMLTAFGSIDSAISAMKLGAFDYVTKPFDNEELMRVVSRSLGEKDATRETDIAKAVGDVAASLAPDDLLSSLKRALEVLVHASGADDGEIFLCEPEGGDPILTAWTGPDSEALVEQMRFSRDSGYPGLVVSTAKPVVTRGTLSDDARYLRRAVVKLGIQSCACVPLSGPGGVLGTVNLFARRATFPNERAMAMLERASAPLESAIRAGLAEVRHAIDRACSENVNPGSPGQLRAVLDAIVRQARCTTGTLALVNATTRQPDVVVSSGPASLLCSHATDGCWGECSTTSLGHGFAADRGRRLWPSSCRQGLPPRVLSPGCLPLSIHRRFYGLVILDFGRESEVHTTSRLVPLLAMAEQAALRLASHREGLLLEAKERTPPGLATQTDVELELCCLGPFVLRRRGHVISAESFVRANALVMLKILALKAGAPVTKDALIEALWPDVDSKSGANRLHGVVHALRSVIEPHRAERRWTFVRSRGDLYYLDMDGPITVDIATFRQGVANGLSLSTKRGEAIEALMAATALYRGDLFEDDPYVTWCEDERRELFGLHVKALARLSELLRLERRSEEALDICLRALRVAPFREDLHVAALELMIELQRPADALAHVEMYRKQALEQLDAAPSAAMKTLIERLVAMRSVANAASSSAASGMANPATVAPMRKR